jgi:hypothetical protein
MPILEQYELKVVLDLDVLIITLLVNKAPNPKLA